MNYFIHPQAQVEKHCNSNTKVIRFPGNAYTEKKKMYTLNALQVAVDKSVCQMN